MNPDSPFANHSDADLIRESGMGHPGYAIEAMRRLRVAVEEQTRAADRQSRAATFFAWAFIFLGAVQIAVAVYDALVP